VNGDVANASWPVQVEQYGCWQEAEEKRSRPPATGENASTKSGVLKVHVEQLLIRRHRDLSPAV